MWSASLGHFWNCLMKIQNRDLFVVLHPSLLSRVTSLRHTQEIRTQREETDSQMNSPHCQSSGQYFRVHHWMIYQCPCLRAVKGPGAQGLDTVVPPPRKKTQVNGKNLRVLVHCGTCSLMTDVTIFNHWQRTGDFQLTFFIYQYYQTFKSPNLLERFPRSTVT